jgi:hypothetical protein
LLKKKIKPILYMLVFNKNDQMVQTEELNKQKGALNVIVNKKEVTQGGTQGTATTSTN